MSKKTRNIAITVVLCIIGIVFICYGTYLLLNKEVDVVEQVAPDFEDTGVDYNGNTWKLEAYNSEDGKYVMLEVYMEEEHDMKWYGEVANGPAEINYIIYQTDHYVISVNPMLESGSSELGFIFDKLEPDHSVTNTYLYYGLSIDTSGEEVDYRVIGGELIDEVLENEDLVESEKTISENSTSVDEGDNAEDELFELNPVAIKEELGPDAELNPVEPDISEE